jgi:hypothetical protein
VGSIPQEVIENLIAVFDSLSHTASSVHLDMSAQKYKKELSLTAKSLHTSAFMRAAQV